MAMLDVTEGTEEEIPNETVDITSLAELEQYLDRLLDSVFAATYETPTVYQPFPEIPVRAFGKPVDLSWADVKCHAHAVVKDVARALQEFAQRDDAQGWLPAALRRTQTCSEIRVYLVGRSWIALLLPDPEADQPMSVLCTRDRGVVVYESCNDGSVRHDAVYIVRESPPGKAEVVLHHVRQRHRALPPSASDDAGTELAHDLRDLLHTIRGERAYETLTDPLPWLPIPYSEIVKHPFATPTREENNAIRAVVSGVNRHLERPEAAKSEPPELGVLAVLRTVNRYLDAQAASPEPLREWTPPKPLEMHYGRGYRFGPVFVALFDEEDAGQELLAGDFFAVVLRGDFAILYRHVSGHSFAYRVELLLLNDYDSARMGAADGNQIAITHVETRPSGHSAQVAHTEVQEAP